MQRSNTMTVCTAWPSGNGNIAGCGSGAPTTEMLPLSYPDHCVLRRSLTCPINFGEYVPRLERQCRGLSKDPFLELLSHMARKLDGQTLQPWQNPSFAMVPSSTSKLAQPLMCSINTGCHKWLTSPLSSTETWERV
eukprot:1790623-Rhodomonas_salina.1